MAKKPEPNPDRIKWDNDSKQKKLTRRHLQQKLEWEERYLKSLENWASRALEDVDKQRLKINQMRFELERMV